MPGETWKTLRQTMDDFQRAMHTGNGRHDGAFRAMQDLVHTGRARPRPGRRFAGCGRRVPSSWRRSQNAVVPPADETTQQLMLYLGAVTSGGDDRGQNACGRHKWAGRF